MGFEYDETNAWSPDTFTSRSGLMFIGSVIGNVVSTHKNDRLTGRKLLLVRRLELDGRESGDPEVIALDVVDAGVGDRVLVVQEGSSARRIMDDDKIPVQAVIVGVVESLTVER